MLRWSGLSSWRCAQGLTALAGLGGKIIQPGTSSTSVQQAQGIVATADTGAQRYFKDFAKDQQLPASIGQAGSLDEFIQKVLASKDPKAKAWAAANLGSIGINDYAKFQQIEKQPGGLNAYTQAQANAGRSGLTAQSATIESNQFNTNNLGMLGLSPGTTAATALGRIAGKTQVPGQQGQDLAVSASARQPKR